MPGDLEQLKRTIEEGARAAEQLNKLLLEQKRGERPKLRLVKGGLIWGAVMAGVEWFRDYRRTAAALALSGLTVTGAVIAEQPHSPGSDPPQAVKPPSVTRPSATPSVRPKPTTALTPRRTSPPRTQVQARITPPPVAPSTTQPAETKKPTQVPTSQPTKTPPSDPIVSLPVAPTITPTLPVDTCTINLLGVKVCLPLG